MHGHRSNSHSGQQRSQQPRVDFICKPKFSNTLPDLPFEGKFLACPFVPLNRFIDYKATLLEKEYKFDVQCELDMGVNIDLVDDSTYKVTSETRHAEMDTKDAILLEDESSNSKSIRRSAQHSKVVPWMRKTEYISSEFNRFGVNADRQEIKVGYHLQKEMQNENLYRDRQSQIDAINKTFEDVKAPVRKHYSKPGVEAVEESYIFPDFDLWKHMFSQVIFDADPSPYTIPEDLRRTALEHSIISGMKDQGMEFVGYYSPNIETLQKIMEDQENGRTFEPEQVYEYPLNREYTWSVTSSDKGTHNENFLFHEQDGVYKYIKLDARAKLTRRRRVGQKANTILRVTPQDPSEAEIEMMNKKMENLLNPEVDKEDEAMESDENEEEENEKEKEGSDAEGSKSSASSKDSDSDNSSSSAAESDDDDKGTKVEKKKSSSEEDDDDSD